MKTEIKMGDKADAVNEHNSHPAVKRSEKGYPEGSYKGAGANVVTGNAKTFKIGK
jgi:hypothetical protein